MGAHAVARFLRRSPFCIQPKRRWIVLASFLIVCLASAAVSICSAAPVSHVANLSAQNESVRSLLLRLGRMYDVNISVAADVQGYATVALRNATADDAIKAVVASVRATVHKANGIYYVAGASGQPPGLSLEATPVTLPVSVLRSSQAAATLRTLFPQANIGVAKESNSLVVIASPQDTAAIRGVLAGIDVRDPTRETTESLSLHTLKAAPVADRLHALYPAARIDAATDRSLVVRATPIDLAQIKTLVQAMDAPNATPPPAPVASEAVRITQRPPKDVARAVSGQFPHVRAGVSASSVVLLGSTEDVTRAKALIAQIDVPAFDARYTQVYRIRNVDANSVAELLRRSFTNIVVTADPSLNALSVEATSAQQQRIADAIAQLDGTAPTVGAPGAGFGQGGGTFGNTELITLSAAVPGQSQSPSTTANDIAQSVTQALQSSSPDLRIVVVPNSSQLILSGSPNSIRTAKELIQKIDRTPPLVVLDTEILEIDESDAKNLGLLLPQAVLSTTFSEVAPVANAAGNTQQFLKGQAITRTPLQLNAQLNLLVQKGSARVLADPRITTLSGRTATIRDGDTIGILTTTGGGVGTITTTQLQTFQTGVTLDITPIVTQNGEINVSLHPIVNSLSGIVNGVPQISTRDTQTTVHLLDNQTLVIGGLIQENSARTDNKIPIIGDIPLIGGLFRNSQLNATRNELIIVVTPHIVNQGEPQANTGPPLLAIPTPKPLPTLPPGTVLPAPLEPRAKAAAAMTPTPVVLPTAAGKPPALDPSRAGSQADAFIFGAIPTNPTDKPNDPVQIYYARVSPTVLHPDVPISVNVMTTANAQRVVLSYQQFAVPLAKAGSQWQSSVTLPHGLLQPGQTTLQLMLTATRADGFSASIAVPMTFVLR
jgi:type II secretory pathway component GspD/PulD (secretin)